MRNLPWPGVLVLLVASCSDRTPASVDLSPRTATLLGAEEIPLRTTVKNKSGKAVDAPVSFVVEPSDVAVITQTKALRCTKAGDVTVTASSGLGTARATFHCRPVARLDTPSDLRLIIPNGPVRLAVAALDVSGNAYRDVTPTLSIEDPSVATASGGEVVPRKVGRTNLLASAGEARSSVAITVVRKLKSEPLLLNDGVRIASTLQQGRYEIEVKGQPTNGGRDGVTLKWIGGGSDCQDSAEAQEIVSSCSISNTGSVIVENPTTFGLGPAFDGFLNIYQVP
jgi:hypothetical protein